jgi:uncharacterized protein (DUF1800 family)
MNGEEVLAVLCAQPQTAKYITKKLWDWFAYEDAEEAVIQRIATKFFNSKLDIKVLLRETMEAPEFYSEKAFRKVIKNPIDFTVATIRQLGVGQTMVARIKEAALADTRVGESGLNIALLRANAPAHAVMSSATSMGLELLTPPDVSGWRTGQYWITSATMVERVKWAEKLFAGGAPTGASAINSEAGKRGPQVGFRAYDILGNCSPAEAVKTLLSIFDTQLPSQKVETLIKVATKESGGKVENSNANVVARMVCKLLFATPEFQMS